MLLKLERQQELQLAPVACLSQPFLAKSVRPPPTIKACIRENKLEETEKHIEKGRDEYGMQTMDQHLIDLCRKELITLDEAKRVSRSKDLERKLMFS